MLRKRFFPNIITIDIKTFDNHMRAILITVIKKNVWEFLLIFRFAILEGFALTFRFAIFYISF